MLSVVIVGFGVSMDAFTVALGKGLSMRKIDIKWALLIAFSFGLFQAIMPLIGYLLGDAFNQYICSCDHWIAFALLLFLGGKMIYEAREKDCVIDNNYKSFKQLLILSIATSIDALAVGITFALIQIDIFIAILIIGFITFVISLLGVFIGNRIGCKFKSAADIVGGLLLIFIGVKILIEHLIL